MTTTETFTASREHVQNVISAALLQHTRTLADADQAASDVLDDLASSGLSVAYIVHDTAPDPVEAMAEAVGALVVIGGKGRPHP